MRAPDAFTAAQRLLQIRQQVLHMLDAHGETDEAIDEVQRWQTSRMRG